MLAIITEVIPASNTRPTRIKAFTCNGHKVVASRDDSLGDIQQHLAVAQRLIREQLRYAPDCATMTYGGSPKGYVFCFPVSTVTLENQ